MKEFWTTIKVLFAGVGGWLGWFLGGCDGLLYALLAFVAADYITGVLPDLDVYDVPQLTMEELFIRLLYEEWDDREVRKIDKTDRNIGIKGQSTWFDRLEQFCEKLNGTNQMLLNPSTVPLFQSLSDL